MISNFKDHYLIKKYLEGDMAAFNSLVEKHKNGLFAFIYNMVKNKQLAEDIFQESFIRVIKNIRTYKEESNFKNWLFRIASNLCKDHWKKKSTQNEVYEEINDESGHVDFIEMIESDEDIEWLRREVDNLPDKFKEVLLLHVYSDMSFKDISKELECSINTVLGRMHYAKKQLKEKWDVYEKVR